MVLLFAMTFVFAESINITVDSCTEDVDAGTVTFALNLQSDADLYGFQFTIDPGTLLTAGAGASGGLAADAGWLVQIGGNGTILGFSMQSTAVLAQSNSENLTNLTFSADAGACDEGLSLINAEPNDEVTVWGSTYNFTGHTFTSFGCSDPMYMTAEECDAALEEWDIVVLDFTWDGVNPLNLDDVYSIKKFNLGSNYPNPFNPSTTINYDVANAGDLSLIVYNMRGQEVNVLASGYHAVNTYSVVWDGTNINGIEMPAGMYIYKLVADGFSKSNKMLFVK